MKILAINGTYRKKGTTTALTEAALEGAASVGAEPEMILLRDHDVRHCTNCLMCYKDLESEISPCSVDDSLGEVLQKIKDADGLILSSPVHNGFVTGSMTVFFERIAWRLCRSTGRILNIRGVPEPRSKRIRALATIVSAGQMRLSPVQHRGQEPILLAGRSYRHNNGGTRSSSEASGYGQNRADGS
jgi:multimeric flavodoxin WrbA